MRVIFAKSADRDMRKLPGDTQRRIVEKIEFYISRDNPLNFAEPLRDSRLGTYRFRIGDLRVIFDVGKDAIIVLKVGHRKDVYR